MGHHLTERGAFKSDKYNWCPEGYFALSFKDPLARQAMLFYANATEDSELADDLWEAVRTAEQPSSEPPVS